MSSDYEANGPRWDSRRRAWVWPERSPEEVAAAEQVREAGIARELAAASAEELARWSWNRAQARPGRHVHRSWTRLTADDVRLIRSLRGQMSHRELAAVFSVSHATIGAILRGESWKEVV